MFWGIILEPKKRYTQTVQQSFHISMAALDGQKETANDNVQVMVNVNNKTFLLCTLNSTAHLQRNLDLNFEQGSQITLMHNGKGYVHLTGYLIPEDNFDMDDLDEEAEEGEEEEDVEQEEVEIQVGNKRKRSKQDQSNKKQKKTLVDVIEEAAQAGSDDESWVEMDEGSSDEDNEEDADAEEESDDEEDEESDEEVPTLVQSPPQKQKKQKQKNNVEKQNGDVKQSNLIKKTIQAGVHIEDINVGNGPVAKPGKAVDVYYVGRLKNNNKQFDAKQSGKPFRFRLGKQEVIQGWDIGVSGMKVGGKRKITCPPNAAYGAKGSPPVIPPNSTLVFEVELKAVR